MVPIAAPSRVAPTGPRLNSAWNDLAATRSRTQFHWQSLPAKPRMAANYPK